LLNSQILGHVRILLDLFVSLRFFASLSIIGLNRQLHLRYVDVLLDLISDDVYSSDSGLVIDYDFWVCFQIKFKFPWTDNCGKQRTS